MAFGKGRENENPMTSRATPAPSSGAVSPGGLTAFIDQGSEFEGKLSFKDTVRIDGRFRGEISSENTLIVGESGEIEATITSNTIAISGSVVGDVVAKQKVVIHKTGCVSGNIQTPSLVIEEGAQLEGQIKMGGAKKTSSSAPLKAVSGSGESSSN
jgi:cytoskeletal protein CcmA (bactofilin family)